MRDYQTMKKYRIDVSRNIGKVIFVVEGGRPEGGTELRLLKAIFTDILGYETHELRRCTDEEFVLHGSNPNSVVYGLNLAKNQLTQLTEQSIDSLFHRLRTELGLKPENCPVFFLYDRDVKSYGRNELRGRYVKRYTDPYGTKAGDQGQLLLSYPSVESYTLSCFRTALGQKRYELGADLKKDIAQLNTKAETKISETDIQTEEHLICAAEKMDAALSELGCAQYDLDDLASTLLAAYDGEQKLYDTEGGFSLLSLISLALMELNVLVEVEEDRKL